MPPANSNYDGVNYNQKKIESEDGKLVLTKNFPSYINLQSSPQDVKNYLRSISDNTNTKKPQFHAVISGRFKENSVQDLTTAAEKFMDEMGYGEQPYLVVFHSDTENHHVHIVSTRVNKKDGKKISDKFEKLKAQRFLNKHLNIDLKKDVQKILDFKVNSLSQLRILAERNGFTFNEAEGKIDFIKNGEVQHSINSENLDFQNLKDTKRISEIKAYIKKYQNVFSNNVFRIEDDRNKNDLFRNPKNFKEPKIEFLSELQYQLRKKFGVDIIFHSKNGIKPYGYSVIDNKTKQVFKGSEIAKMDNIFNFTDEKINKRHFETASDFSIKNDDEKSLVINYFKAKGINFTNDSLFINNKRITRDDYIQGKRESERFLNGDRTSRIEKFMHNGESYFFSEQHHTYFKEDNLYKQNQTFENNKENKIDLTESISDAVKLIMKNSSGGSSGKENSVGNDELKKRKKKRR